VEKSAVMKLGTRKSLLAWAQSSWVAREIEKANPGTRVELVGIETRGDKILDMSLQAISETTGGKEFFVAEIDEALRSGAVDLTVHSMKDLSLDRPPELRNAAIPKRENPRDVALFGPGVLEKLRQGKPIRIGTSSPRRVENIPAFLSQALPQLSGTPRLEFKEIRGNVNTRLGRVHELASSPKQLDAVILAFAGLIRLWKDDKGREELKKLLEGVRWMVLPLRECPAAPAQGALAIECRTNDSVAFEKIRKIHCADTEAHVAIERRLLGELGGGCHQKFGATAVSTENLSKLFYVRGRKPDGSSIDEFYWSRPSVLGGAKPTEITSWNGNEWRAKQDEGASSENGAPSELPIRSADFGPGAYFVSHWRAFPKQETSADWVRDARVWTSGTASWFKLASLGVWVEGCAENLGFDTIRKTLEESVLQLSPLHAWKVLSHSKAAAEWKAQRMHMIKTYELSGDYSSEALEALSRASHIFWSSGSQYDELKGHIPRHAHQACGPGKTSDHLLKDSVRPAVFPSVEEWKKWINED
jgi:hydroxymethylbilane synthase